MKRLYTTICLLALCATCGFAQYPGFRRVPQKQVRHATPAPQGRQLVRATTQASDLNFSYVPVAMYTPNTDETQNGNYYIEVSSVNATYDSESGVVFPSEGWGICLDLYSPNTEKPYNIPEGTYNSSSETDKPAFSYDPLYTYAKYYSAAGTEYEDFNLTSPVSVSKNGEEYTIQTTTSRNGVEYNLTFKGKIVFQNTSESTGTLPSIGQDINAECTGGLGIYQGNLFGGGTGNMEITLYTAGFDSETGGQTEPGYAIKMSVFNTLFADPKDAVVKAGTYTPSFKFTRNTFLPGTEVNYMGITMILGSLAQYYDGQAYKYASITEGTCTVVEEGDGIFTVTVDATTGDGYKVQASYTGKIPVIDNSDDTPVSHISSLTDDVELDLEQITVARYWKVAAMENSEGKLFSQFTLDIGSPSGRDESVEKNGGDIFRIQFIGTDDYAEPIMPEGTYEVMESRYPASVKAFGLLPGYLWDGDLIGTRYYHFIEGKEGMYMDELAPAAEGSVTATKNADGTYTFHIDVVDDAGYKIQGDWTGPLEFMGDISGIESVTGENSAISYTDANHIHVGGLAAGESVRIYSATGQLMLTTANASQVDISHLGKGVYVLQAGTHPTFKFVRK